MFFSALITLEELYDISVGSDVSLESIKVCEHCNCIFSSRLVLNNYFHPTLSLLLCGAVFIC